MPHFQNHDYLRRLRAHERCHLGRARVPGAARVGVGPMSEMMAEIERAPVELSAPTDDPPRRVFIWASRALFTALAETWPSPRARQWFQ